MYTRRVRRIIATSLLILFGLPLIAPLLALSHDPDANLPVCCRRNGKHHCMMSAEMMQAMLSGTRVSVVPMKCPMYPRAMNAAQHHELSLHTAALLFAEIISHPAMHLQTEARGRVSRFCARQKRGPPSIPA
ncbi:MAG TPA: hypothetical protein VGB94_14625 [Acidobacteriaceae bacterium]